MTGFGALTVDRAVQALGSRSDLVAGGAGCALAAAAAAALVELTSGLAASRVERERPGEPGSSAASARVAARARALRERLILLADEDSRAYAAVGAAPDRDARAVALAAAAAAPLEIAELGAELADAAARIEGAGDWPFRPDAVVARELAIAASRGAAALVAANLAAQPEDPRLERARAAAARAGRPRDNRS